MRISWASLLVVLAIATPVLVQIRTVAYMVGIELTMTESVVIGALVIAGILVWAFFPTDWWAEGDAPRES